ncbi:fibrinogen-like protein 1 [Drosophila willistoni]|nr:fibrinogen-like protein 1 [Drosophila willistoni]
MSESVGHMFTTWDRDNDNWLGYNCAREMGGGWWYSNCGKSNLNGPYVEDFGLTWHTWRKFKSIKATEMMIRRKSIIL